MSVEMLRHRNTTTAGAASDAATATTTTTKNNKAEAQPVTAAAAAAAKTASTWARELLSIDLVPEWYGENPYIITGYRPVFAAALPCFKSWLYLHNQTGNIYTHLVPGVAAVAGNAVLAAYFEANYPGATLTDRLVFHVYLTAVATCFGVSAAYHTLLCHSEQWADLWIRLDYVCISALIMASFVPGLYMGFYCEPMLLRSYLGLIFCMGVYNSYLSMTDRCGSKDWLKSRLLPFLALGLSAFIPIIHAALLFPYNEFQKQAGLNYYYIEGAFMVTGVIFLITKFPECWLPGRFDYLGCSHQIFHCFVVFGTISHFIGILSGYDYNYSNPRCGLRQVATQL